MASDTTGLESLELTPPPPVQTVTTEQAAGLFPLDEGQKSRLEAKADSFIADLVAQDAKSPEFGKRVDQLTNINIFGKRVGG